MPLPESFLEELKARCDMAEVASSYVNLKRSGKNLVGLCPFHSEKTPSFNVYPDNGSFYCFGCGVGGDVITFIRRIENLDYMEAVRFLAQRAGLTVPENQVDDGMAKLRTRILALNRETARFYYSVLMSEAGAAGREYFSKRQLQASTIRHFGLGYSPPGRFALVDHLEKKGFTQQEMILANVAFQSRSGRAVDRFSGRVMFPIIDLRGNVVAFGGRTLGDDKPKYLNTADTPVFNKGDMLFALNFAKNNNGGRLILCEGYMDVISLHQAGFTNAVATLGTALTPSQARLMSRYAKEVVVSYDSDGAGQKAAARAIPMLRSAGLLVKVLSIAGGKDPDEYIKTYGALRFKQMLDNCGNDVEYQLQKAKEGCNLQTAEGRVAYLRGSVQVLAALDNNVEREVYAGKVAEETGIETATLLSQVNAERRKIEKNRRRQEFREIRQKAVGYRDNINPEKAQHLRAAAAEEALIAYLMKNPGSFERIYELLPPEKFITEFNRRVYARIVGRMKEEKSVSLTDLAEEFSPDELSYLAGILAKHDGVSAEWKDALEYVNVIRQEDENRRLGNAAQAQLGEIEKYLEKLKQQKK
ncbi:DNA primase [Thermocaproicibacter melissae]|uniref:DNA primase n=1 Tax=Thermocaproicibacter melissae TaxID=2966552 RepID=UPI0024B1C91C|nr:DNA primase [Thermocaproicibacter melissae]WBY63394.1 DNA primase [Thermocaproicibacter melissae]